MAIAVKLTNDMDVDGFELLNANSFNGVALTDSGSAADFLNAQGNYITLDVGDLLNSNNVWTGTNQFTNGLDLDGSNLVDAGTIGTLNVNSTADLLSLKTLGTARITMTSSLITLTKNTIIDNVASIDALDGVSTTARFGHKDFNLLSGFGFAQRNTGVIDINAATGQNVGIKVGNVNRVVVDSITTTVTGQLVATGQSMSQSRIGIDGGTAPIAFFTGMQKLSNEMLLTSIEDVNIVLDANNAGSVGLFSISTNALIPDPVFTVDFNGDVEITGDLDFPNTTNITNVQIIEVNTINNAGGALTLMTGGTPRMTVDGGSNGIEMFQDLTGLVATFVDSEVIGVPLILSNGGTANSTSISLQNSDNSHNIELRAEFFANEEFSVHVDGTESITMTENFVTSKVQLISASTFQAQLTSFFFGIADFASDTKHDANFQIRNKDDSTDISFITRNVTGSEVVMDFTNVGEINGVTLTDAGVATDFLNATGAYSTPVATVDESLDYDWTGLHTFNNAANTPVDFEDGVNTNQANYIIKVGGDQRFFVGATGAGTFSNGSFGCGDLSSSGDIVANTGLIQTASILRSEVGANLVLGRNGSSTAKVTLGASTTTFADEIVQDGSNEFGLTVKDPDNLISSVSYNKTIKFTDSANAVAALIGYTNGADNDFDIFHNASSGRIKIFTEGDERISITQNGGDSLIDTPSGVDLQIARSGSTKIELQSSAVAITANTNITGFLTTTSLLQVLSGGIESTNGVYQTGSDTTNLVLRAGTTGDSLTINDTAHTATFTSGVDVVADDFSGTFTGVFNNSTTSILVEDNDNATIQIIASDQFIIDISTGGNPVTYDLEASPSAGRRVVIIRDQSTNTVTVDGNGNNIGTRTTNAATEALADQEKLDIIFDGVIWYRL